VIFATGFAVAESVRLPRERAVKLALWVAAALAATLVTPYGYKLYPYLVHHLSMQSVHHIAELRRLDLHHSEDIEFVVAVLVAAILVGRARAKVDRVDLLATIGFLALACLAAREANLALIALAVTVAPVLAATIREARGELIDNDRALHVFAWSFALLAGFGLPLFELASEVLKDEVGTGLGAGQYPVLEADWIIEKKPHGKLWNQNASGGYLIWRLEPIEHPEWRVFTDGRQPLFTHAVTLTTQQALEEHAPNVLVFDTLSPPYDGIPLVHEKYRLVHFSDGGRTYLRTDSQDAALVRGAYRYIWFDSVKDGRTFYGYRSRLVVSDENTREAKEELLRGALREEPGGYWANVALAQVLYRDGDRQGAAQAARRALEATFPRSKIQAFELLQAAEAAR